MVACWMVAAMVRPMAPGFSSLVILHAVESTSSFEGNHMCGSSVVQRTQAARKLLFTGVVFGKFPMMEPTPRNNMGDQDPLTNQPSSREQHCSSGILRCADVVRLCTTVTGTGQAPTHADGLIVTTDVASPKSVLSSWPRHARTRDLAGYQIRRAIMHAKISMLHLLLLSSLFVHPTRPDASADAATSWPSARAATYSALSDTERESRNRHLIRKHVRRGAYDRPQQNSTILPKPGAESATDWCPSQNGCLVHASKTSYVPHHIAGAMQ